MFENLNKPLEEEIKPEIKTEIKEEDIEIKDPELDKILTDREKYKIEKEAQASALTEKFTTDPKAIVTSNISKTALELIKSNEKFKDRISKVSEGTAKNAIEEVEGKNRKGNNQNYFLGREEAIESLGGDSKTSKDKQTYINIIYNFWWYIMMTFLGIPFIAPLKVLMNWAKALSPEIIANIEEDGKVRTEKVKKLHWLPVMFATIFYLLYLVGLGFLIYFIIKAII